MASNTSRYSHQRDRRYSQLILSQGAMVTDADQREGMAIGLRNVTGLGDVAIRSGVPQTEGIVVWTEVATPSAHKTMTGIRPGKVVADGHVGEVRLATGATAPADAAGLDLLGSQQDLQDWAGPSGFGGPLLVFADIWHGHVGPALDARQVDPAFLSAETATRTELMAQLKVAAITGGVDPDAALALRTEAEGLPRYGDFRLTEVDFTSVVQSPDACDPCATTLDDPNQDAGNDLFRLEIHESGYNHPAVDAGETPPAVQCQAPASGLVTLKWSHDNGSVELPIARAAALLDDSAYDEAVFELTWPAAEQRLGLYPDGMTDRLATLHGRAAIEAALAAAPAGAILRVWDGAVTIDLTVADLAPVPIGALSAEGSIATTATTWKLELQLGGLALTLEAEPLGTTPYLLPGDAWCVEIREYATGTGDKLIWIPEPVEIEHHYTFVGVVENGAFRNEAQPDMRARAFPALTELDALDIAYDNSTSGVAAWTVQGALDLIFAAPPADAECDCLCTYTIDPDQDFTEQLEAILKLIIEEKLIRVLICIPAGLYKLSRQLKVELPKVVLILRGAGRDVTVIDISAAETGSGGVFEFIELASARVEELSIVGAVKPFTPDPLHVIAAINLGEISLHRSVVAANRTDAGLIHGLASITRNDRPAETSVTVTESLFRLGDGAQGIGIWDGASRLHVERSEFRAVSIENFGGSRKLALANDLVAKTRLDRRIPDREQLIKDRLYAPYPDNSELLLNFTAIPEEDRPAALRYWTLTLRQLSRASDVQSPKDFEDLKTVILSINDAAGRVVEAELLTLGTARDGAEPISRDQTKVLNALTRTGNPLFGSDSDRTGLGDVRTGNLDTAMAILVAGGSLRGDLGNVDDPSGALASVLAAGKELRGKATVASYVEHIAPALDLVVARAESGPPTWGISSVSPMPLIADIVGNAFLDLDVAIDLASRPPEVRDYPFDAPTPMTIRDNMVRRLLRAKGVFSREWGGNFDFNGPRHPITIDGACDVAIENNDLTQVIPTGMPEDEYRRIWFDPIPDSHASYAAISLYDAIGPKLRCSGNSAFSFRHCINVDCRPLHQPPRAFWLFTGNSALPLGENTPAVWVSPNAENAINGGRMVHRDNWFPNQLFEPL